MIITVRSIKKGKIMIHVVAVLLNILLLISCHGLIIAMDEKSNATDDARTKSSDDFIILRKSYDDNEHPLRTYQKKLDGLQQNTALTQSSGQLNDFISSPEQSPVQSLHKSAVQSDDEVFESLSAEYDVIRNTSGNQLSQSTMSNHKNLKKHHTVKYAWNEDQKKMSPGIDVKKRSSVNFKTIQDIALNGYSSDEDGSLSDNSSNVALNGYSSDENSNNLSKSMIGGLLPVIHEELYHGQHDNQIDTAADAIDYLKLENNSDFEESIIHKNSDSEDSQF